MSKLVKKQRSVGSITLPESMVDDFVQEYSYISAQIKTLTERKKTLAGMIKNYALNHGTRDDKGSYYCENAGFVFGVVSKSTMVARNDIIDVLKEMGRKDCIDILEVANMDAINKYHDEGIISDDDIKELFEVKEMTPSISVKEKKELVEVEKKAASRKR